jgi:hypothetical protein
VHKSTPVSGRVHDYCLFKHRWPSLPKLVRRRGDLGYSGVAGDFLGLDFVILFKRKSPGGGSEGLRQKRCCLSRRRLIRRWRLSGWFVSILIVG